jgi:hypothetical protein
MDERERETDEVSAARQAAEEPEPDWAEQIRRLRKQRGDRLKQLLGTDDDDPRPEVPEAE